MAKGNYKINGHQTNVLTEPKDASFKACLCTMLVLIALLVMIILMTYSLKQQEGTNSKLYHSRYNGEKEETEEFTDDIKSQLQNKKLQKLKDWPTEESVLTTHSYSIGIIKDNTPSTHLNENQNVTKTDEKNTDVSQNVFNYGSSESIDISFTTKKFEYNVIKNEDYTSTEDILLLKKFTNNVFDEIDSFTTESTYSTSDLNNQTEYVNHLTFDSQLEDKTNIYFNKNEINMISSKTESNEMSTDSMVFSEYATDTTQMPESNISKEIIDKEFLTTSNEGDKHLTTINIFAMNQTEGSLEIELKNDTSVTLEPITETTTLNVINLISQVINQSTNPMNTPINEDIFTTPKNTEISIGQTKTLSEQYTENSVSHPKKLDVISYLLETTTDKVNLPLNNIKSPASNFSSSDVVSAQLMCSTESCKVSASRMLSLISHTEDMCEDIYKFACGGLQDSTTILERNIGNDISKRMIGILKKIDKNSPIVYQKFKAYYKSCVDYDTVDMDLRISTGKEVLKSIGTMVVAGDPTLHLTDLLIQLFRHDSAPLFDINFDKDTMNNSNFIISITEPKWRSSIFQSENDKTSRCRYKPDEDISESLNTGYEIYIKCLKNHSHFFQVVQEAMEKFQVFDTLNATLLIQETRFTIEWDILELMEDLPNINVITQDLQDKIYNLKTVEELSKSSSIKWEQLFNELFNITVFNNTQVQVYFHEYLEKVNNKLRTTEPRKMQNALLGIFAHKLYTDLIEVNHPCEREKYCINVANKLMTKVASNIYLESFPATEISRVINKTREIYVSLISKMTQLATNISWMDDVTSEAVKLKLSDMDLQFPPIFDITKIEQYLQKMDLEDCDYIKTSILLTKVFKNDFYSYYKDYSLDNEIIYSHFLSPFNTQTKYIYNLNTIAITLHTLLPFEDLTLPSYIIMAKLGFPLAHGIVQAFDTTGIKFKAGGLHEDIISPDSFDYYNRYYIFNNQFWFEYLRTIEDHKVYTYSINTLYTLNSRMSDISATKLLLETISHFGGMKEWLPYGNFTPHQTFHLSLLQEFCSKKTVPESIPELFESADLIELLRVNYIAANVEDFGIVFNCRNGSTLNPSERADSFPIFKIEESSPDYKEIKYS